MAESDSTQPPQQPQRTDQPERREFVKRLALYAAAGAGVALVLPLRLRKETVETGEAAPTQATGPQTLKFAGKMRQGEAPANADVVVARDKDAGELVSAAVKAYGGIERFVKKGDKVVIKPNLAFARTPEQAANTQPRVLQRVIELCFEAGAAAVTVLDHTIDVPVISFEMSGAQAVCDKTGAELFSPKDKEIAFTSVPVPAGKILEPQKIVTKILEADCFINLPIAKQHNDTHACLGMKNLMGAVWARKYYHQTDIHQCIADLSTVLRPTLTIIDATRVMLSDGPKGGGTAQVKELKTVVVGVNPVSTDAVACEILGAEVARAGTDTITLETVKHIAIAAQMGLGPVDTRTGVRIAQA